MALPDFRIFISLGLIRGIYKMTQQHYRMTLEDAIAFHKPRY
ncbi:MAG: hypothetical protein AB4426_28120 [Xenococcaceae cyanobacterium]